MNLPNKITLFRVILIPVFLVILLGNFMDLQTSRIVATVVFIIASLTDALDGYIARSQNLITNFGKFMDPLADKLLVSAALISMVQLGDLSAWIVILIISREFIVTGFRLIASNNDIVIAASIWGKFKTISQMIMIILILSGLNNVSLIISYISDITVWLSVILTLLSAIDYILKNIEVLKED